MAEAAPVQPLPEWMSTTYLPAVVPGEASRLVTIVYPQTYSGASIPGLTWPWVSPNVNNPNAGTLVSVIGEAGGEGGLTRVGGTREAAEASISAGDTSDSAGQSVPRVTPTSNAIASTSRIPSASTVSRPGTSSVPATAIPPISASSASASLSFSTTSATNVVPVASSSSLPSPSSSSVSSRSDLSSTITSPLTSVSSSSIPSSSTSLSGVTQSASNNPGSLSSGAIASLVLGSIAGFLFLLLLLIALLRRRKRRRLNQGGYAGGDDAESGPFLQQHIAANPEMMSSGGTGFLPIGSTAASSYTSPESQILMTGYRGNIRRHQNDSDTIEALAGESGTFSNSRTRNTSAATGESSNPSQSTGGSTTTRGSLIAQFPTYRKPSDDSSPGGGHGTGPNGNESGGSGHKRDGSRRGDGSPATMASSDLFSAPPPRPPSRTRTVAVEQPRVSQVQSPQISPVRELGLGRPSSQKVLPRIPPPRFEDESTNAASSAEATSAIPIVMTRSPSTRSPGFIVSHGEDYQDHLENYHNGGHAQRTVSEASGVGGWLGNFGFLRPYLAGTTPIPRANSQRREKEAAIDGEASLGQKTEKLTPLPSSIPLDRSAPSYRRVTTTAAAYSSADLEDLRRKPTIRYTKPSIGSQDIAIADLARSADHSNEEAEDGDESRSFLDHGPDGTEGDLSVASKAQLKGAERQRWSRTTLGRPIRRLTNISGISQISLSDARSISESIVGSVLEARSRSTSKSRSRSNSNSAHSRRRPSESGTDSLSVSRANSLAAQSHSSRSDNGSASSRAKRARRQNNSSGSTNAGSTGSHSNQGSRTSAKSDDSDLGSARGRLRKVSEYGEVPPPLPKPLPLPGQT